MIQANCEINTRRRISNKTTLKKWYNPWRERNIITKLKNFINT